MQTRWMQPSPSGHYATSTSGRRVIQDGEASRCPSTKILPRATSSKASGQSKFLPHGW